MSEQTKKAERIGVLGGTFDPIHLGHLIIAEQARDQYSLDKVLLIPSGHSYFKDNRSKKVQPAQVRLEMTKIAAGDYGPFDVSDIEVNRPGNTYSFETADTICSMRTWKEPKRIFDVCTVLAAMREDQVDPDSFKKESLALGRDFGARILPVEIPNIGISSTKIRERASLGKSIHYLVPDALESYIIETGIYK